MKPEWKSFIEHAGAEFGEDRILSFGNPDQERRIVTSGSILCDLSHYGLISIYGDDAVTFLQGQFTNDISVVDTTQSQLSSYCNPKGRMLANFRIFKRDETLYISLPYELHESILTRLRMYLMRSKATLEDAGDALMRFGLNGPEADQQLQTITGEVPLQVNDVTQYNNCSIIRCHGTTPRFEIYGLIDDMQQLWQALDVNAAPVGAGIWEWLNIQAGIPVITASTSEAYVPQMANMDIIEAINFKKGCYTGQEIVARMHYLGKLKRRMYHVTIDTKEAPKSGDNLFTEKSTAGTGTGTIVSAELNAEGSYDALAVLQIKDAENEVLKLHDAKGPSVTMAALPYSLESSQETG